MPIDSFVKKVELKTLNIELFIKVTIKKDTGEGLHWNSSTIGDL